MDTTPSTWSQHVAERMRVLIVAGVLTGVVVAGIGSRLAMLLLRVTSSERVIGVTSDDGFNIGKVTVGGTYSLLMLGAAVGILGAAVYRLVAPWLIGPNWLRRLTTALASGAVVGSMLVHADGVDFTLLTPTWLAIGTFVALPALFGGVIGIVVDSVASPSSWTRRGKRQWFVPLICVAAFPATLFFLAFMLIAVGLWALARDIDFPAEVRSVKVAALAVRAVWLAIAVGGLAALLNDIRAIA